MAGTATINLALKLTSLGNAEPLDSSFSITGVDEYVYHIEQLAATTPVALDVGTIDTVTGIYIKLIDGGTTAATALSVDLSATTWAATDFVIREGQSVFLESTAGSYSVKNLNDETATFEYFIFGDNA